MTDRTFDVILWGASGFTGRLVAEYYLKQYGLDGDLKWGIAGRNRSKLENIRKELGNEDIPVLIADSMNMDSLNAMVQQTKVICTTVGPYAKYGSNLVEACVNNGTDCCDLTGEVQWIRRMVDAHHETAKANGVRIVNCCGFDSIPSDMGVYFLQKEAKERAGEYCQQIKFRVKAMKGGFSGGTYASLNNVMMEAMEDPSIMTLLENPYSLNPVDAQDGNDVNDISAAEYDTDFDAWISPFVMAGINTRVVRRSQALQDFSYGKDFRYDEATLMGDGFSGKVKAKAFSGIMGFMTTLKPDSGVKKVVDRFLPKPGEGPSKADRESGFYSIILLGKFKNGTTLTAKVKGDRDPGYGSTSKMLGEAAACLAKDKDKTPSISGVLTPSTAMGDVLLERLQANAGLTFMVK